MIRWEGHVTCVEDERCIQIYEFFCWKSWGRDHLEDLGIDGIFGK